MIESQQVLEWMAMGEAKGEAKGEARGEIRGEINSLLEVLATRFPPGASAELAAALRASTDLNQVRAWLRNAVKTETLEAFRQTVGL